MEDEKSESEEKSNESIKESLRHEDFMYYAFLYGVIATILSIVFHYDEKVTSGLYEIFLIIIFPSAICIILFSLFRFFGIILEDNIWRYISVHGLFVFLFVYIFFISTYFLFIFSWDHILRIIEKYTTVYLWSGYLFLGSLVLLFLLWKIIIGKTNSFIKNRLYRTEKYRKIKEEDRITLDSLIPLLGVSLAFLFMTIFLLFVTNVPEGELYKLDNLLRKVGLCLSICFFIISTIDFYLIKNKKRPILAIPLKRLKHIFGKK